MTKVIYRIIISLFILPSMGLVYGQTDFRPGYVIEHSGDTLTGEIDYRGDFIMGGFCKFRNVDGETRQYSPYDIEAYRFKDSKYFVSKAIDGHMVFLEYLINGQVSIYYLRDDDGNHYYLERDGVGLTEIPFEESEMYVNGKRMINESKKHMGLLNYYMQDAPEFRSQIESVKKPAHKNLIKLAENYHNAVCEGEQCIIYEKKEPFTGLSIEVVSGVVNFVRRDGEALANKYQFQNGLIAHFWLPRANEKLYLKTGLLFSRFEDINGDRNSRLIVPIHIGYLAPKTYRIRPHVSMSLISSSYSAGVSTKVGERMYLGCQGWVNFTSRESFPWIPNQLANYSILGSMYFEF